MIGLAAETGAGVVAMHMLGTPATMQDDPRYQRRGRRGGRLSGPPPRRPEAAGIGRRTNRARSGHRLRQDPQHNITLAAHCHRLHALGCPILVGHSRKGFIGKALADKRPTGLAGTIGVALAWPGRECRFSASRRGRGPPALVLFEAIGGIDGEPIELAD